MTKTVDELRNEIRDATGRFEREISATFTKEDLAALCEALDCDINLDPLPSTATMRGAIRSATSDAETDSVDRPFRKGELEAIAEALTESA